MAKINENKDTSLFFVVRGWWELGADFLSQYLLSNEGKNEFMIILCKQPIIKPNAWGWNGPTFRSQELRQIVGDYWLCQPSYCACVVVKWLLYLDNQGPHNFAAIAATTTSARCNLCFLGRTYGKKHLERSGRGGDLVVSLVGLDLYNPSSNPSCWQLGEKIWK